MGKDLTVEDAAKLLGLREPSIYKGIDHNNIPAKKEIVNGKVEVRIPAAVFMVCIQNRKKEAQKKVDHLTRAEEMLRRHLNGN